MDLKAFRPAKAGVFAALMAFMAGCTQLTDVAQLDADPAAGGALPEEAQQVIADAKPKPDARIDGAAPEVFQATDFAIWDGKPTFGDIWIAMADLDQPERVEIKNEETGDILRGSMLLDDRPPFPDAPIRLSSGAAQALGAAPLVPIRITVTALRKTSVYEEASLPQTKPAEPAQLAGADPVAVDDFTPLSRGDVTEAPDLTPPSLADGFIEVAQATNPADAIRVADELTAQAIPTQVQEDFINGETQVRVFAATDVDAGALVRTLSALDTPESVTPAPETQFGNVAEILAVQADDATDWVAVGAFTSRNEAMSVVQRLSRTAVPTEVCESATALDPSYRVFAGPAGAVLPPSNTDGRRQMSNAFCHGVAASESIDILSSIQSASAPTVGQPITPAPSPVAAPTTAVRIKVGQSTGDLNLRVPNPYSQPVLVPVGDVLVTIPKTASPELVDAIRRALETVE